MRIYRSIPSHRFASAIATLLLLAGCKEHSVPAAVQPAVRPAADVATAMTAVSGEGSLPVELRFGLAQAPLVGASFPFGLMVTSATPQPTLRVQVHADPGLEVVEGAEGTVDRLEPAVAARRDVTLRASTPGVHLVTVVVAIDLAGGAPARTFVVPVLVTVP